MATMLVHQQVKDYNAWKSVYDSSIDMRKSNGEISDKIYLDDNDPNNVTILFKWDSMGNAKKFAQSPELKAAMEKAGVTSPPVIHFLKEA